MSVRNIHDTAMEVGGLLVEEVPCDLLAVAAMSVTRMTLRSTSLLLPTGGISSCLQHNRMKSIAAGLSQTHLSVQWEKKFSKGSWFSLRVIMNLKSDELHSSDPNLTSAPMDSCQPAKHFTLFVTSFPLSVLTRIVVTQSKQSLRNFYWSHVPSTDRGRLHLFTSLSRELFMQSNRSLNCIKNSAVSLALLPTTCEWVSGLQQQFSWWPEQLMTLFLRHTVVLSLCFLSANNYFDFGKDW